MGTPTPNIFRESPLNAKIALSLLSQLNKYSKKTFIHNMSVHLTASSLSDQECMCSELS